METTRDETPYISNEEERPIHNSDKIKENVQFEDFLSDDANALNELNKNESRAWKNSAIVAATNAPDLRSSTIKTNEIQGWRKSTTLQKQALRFDASANPNRITRDTDECAKSMSLRKSQLWDRLIENNEGSIGSSSAMDVTPSFYDNTKLDEATRLSCDIFSVYFNDHHAGVNAEKNGKVNFIQTVWHSIDGTMSWLNQWLEHENIPFVTTPLTYMDWCMRGIGQIFFCNNPLSGAFILAALFIQSSRVAVHCILAVLSATLSARAFGFEKALISSGLFGYNAALIGIGLASFHSLEVHGGYSPVILACVMIVSILSVILFASLSKVLLAYEISPMTLPFDIVVSLTLLASNGMANVEFGAVIPPSLPSYTIEQDTPDYNIDAFAFMGIVLRGIGQIVFTTDPLAIALVIAGLTLCSRHIAIAALVGSALGTGISILVGLNAEEVDLGLYSYCSALTFIGTLVFYVPTLMSILLAALGVLFTVIFQVALSSLFQISGLPVNSFPFSFVIISFVLCQGNAKAFIGVPLESITFPEDHLKRVRLLRDGFHLFLEALRSNNEEGLGDRKIANSNRSRKVLTKLYSTMNFETKIEIEETDKIGQQSLQMFENMEKKHQKGYITFDDFEELLGKLGMNAKDGLFSARKALSLLDIDNNGMISKQEWVVFCRLSYELQKIHDIVSTFFQFVDTSGDRYIQVGEVNEALNYLGEPELNFGEMKTIGRIAHSPEEFEIREMTTFVSIETLKTLVKKYQNRPSSQRNKNDMMEEV
ncbi:hypothetical protein CTEN210_08209 [Chaetoceros tenuissimus]|uniref:EF-hand domain-containing protein n=1 Tax=Chaetoceros tenuissimus TaxID=426638 RepID=A0AAD3CTM0_9STRA|nr:hypothetical protein CTEN210_08209 [Chaetoceros tenuissimus]